MNRWFLLSDTLAEICWVSECSRQAECRGWQSSIHMGVARDNSSVIVPLNWLIWDIWTNGITQRCLPVLITSEQSLTKHEDLQKHIDITIMESGLFYTHTPIKKLFNQRLFYWNTIPVTSILKWCNKMNKSVFLCRAYTNFMIQVFIYLISILHTLWSSWS